MKERCVWQVHNRDGYQLECNLGVNVLRRCPGYPYLNCEDYKPENLATKDEHSQEG